MSDRRQNNQGEPSTYVKILTDEVFLETHSAVYLAAIESIAADLETRLAETATPPQRARLRAMIHMGERSGWSMGRTISSILAAVKFEQEEKDRPLIVSPHG